MKNEFKTKAAELKAACPLPNLLKAMHLEKFNESSCCSPFRKDAKPSWGVYGKNGASGWKDFGTGEGGDGFSFLATYLGLNEKTDFNTLFRIYNHFAQKTVGVFIPKAIIPGLKPDKTGFTKGTTDQINALAKLRGFSTEALQIASNRGLLVFNANWHGQAVYGVTDSSGKVLEIRRLDGAEFPEYKGKPACKSKAVKGSIKHWPVGIHEAQAYQSIVLLEGIPDFLAAFHIALAEGALDKVAPVCMLGAATTIPDEALQLFKGKSVRIVPHLDEAGQKAAAKWYQQLQGFAAKVSFINLKPAEDHKTKDLCDYKDIHLANLKANPEGRMLSWPSK